MEGSQSKSITHTIVGQVKLLELPGLRGFNRELLTSDWSNLKSLSPPSQSMSLHAGSRHLLPRFSLSLNRSSSLPTLPTLFADGSAIMSLLTANGDSGEKPPTWQTQATNQRDLGVQVILSVAFGLSAFIAFCVCYRKPVNRCCH